MALEIHPGVQNADNVDASGGYAEEQHMRSGRKAPVAFTNVVATPAKTRIGRDSLNGSLNSADIEFRLPFAQFLRV